MCGIAGFVSNNFNQDQLVGMTDTLIHRGPDSKGYFFDEQSPIGLGHRRLSIVDLTNEADQPMTSHCGRYVMVFNGEVYNFEEIAKNIDRKWNTKSDTEVILEAFVEYKSDFVNYLNGMFAIAIWDKKSKQLSLFRDRFGIKPLLYYFDGKNFVFASELKALLFLGLPRELNKESVKDYLFLEYIPNDQTIFNNYFKLKPGHCAILNEKKELKIEQYYSLIDQFSGPNNIAEGEALEELKEKLTQSVEYRKMGDVPIGSFLSGGTDSSLICSIYQEISNQPIETFNIGFDVAKFDESKYATRVAQHLKTNHHRQMVTEKEAKSNVENIVNSYDEPFAVPSVIPTTILSEKTKEHVSVALSGDGGDELFMGYGYYNWYNRVEKLKKIGGKTGLKIASALLSYSNPKHKRASRVMDIPSMDNSWLHILSQEQYMFTEKEISELFSETYVHSSTLQNWNEINDLPIHPFQKISLFDIQNYLSNDLLHKVDIASMSTGLELRVPLLDHNLVEFAINLPLELKVNEGEQKYLLKKLLSSYLPKDLVYRQKWGFPAPMGVWLLNDLYYLIDKYLNRQIINQMGLFNYNFIEKLVNEFKNGHDYHFKRVWALIYFSMWYKKWG